MKDTKLSVLLERYHVGINFNDTSGTKLGNQYWRYFFCMIYSYKIEDTTSLESVFIKEWLNKHEKIQNLKYSKGSNQFTDPESVEFYSLLCKLEKEGKIKIPKVIKLLFNQKSKVFTSLYYFHNFNINLKDIKEYLEIGDYILASAIMEPNREKYEKKLFIVYALSEKRGIARASGNGAMLSLPKKWLGSEVHAFEVSKNP